MARIRSHHHGQRKLHHQRINREECWLLVLRRTRAWTRLSRDYIASWIMPEGLNPTRRYKWFRPRQANRGYTPLVTPTNHLTAYLYNQGTGAQVLVVRQVYWTLTGTALMGFVSGNAGSSQTTLGPMVGFESVRASQIYYQD